MKLSKKASQFLLELARKSIEYFLETKNFIPYETVTIPVEIAEEVNRLSGAFVLLEMTKNEHRKAYIKGFNGMFEGVEQLGKLITQISVNAAFFDSSTPRLKAYELNELMLHIFIPTDRKKMYGDYATILAQLEGTEDGILAETRGRFAYSLPTFVGDSETTTHRVRKLRLQLGIKKKDAENATDYYVFSGQHFKEN